MRESHAQTGLQALGLQVDENVSADVGRTLGHGHVLLSQLQPAALRTLHAGHSGIAMACAPFLAANLAHLKAQAKRQGGVVGQEGRAWLLQLLEVRWLGGCLCSSAG